MREGKGGGGRKRVLRGMGRVEKEEEKKGRGERGVWALWTF